MKTIDEIRRGNLARLVIQYGSINLLATKLERSYPQISQWINASKDSKTGQPRGIGNNSARRIEELTDKPRGWFDFEHGINETIYNPITKEAKKIAKMIDAREEDQDMEKILRVVSALSDTDLIDSSAELEISGPTGKTTAMQRKQRKQRKAV